MLYFFDYTSTQMDHITLVVNLKRLLNICNKGSVDIVLENSHNSWMGLPLRDDTALVGKSVQHRSSKSVRNICAIWLVLNFSTPQMTQTLHNLR